MRICNQEFNSDIILEIKRIIDEEPTISRGKLSRQVCQLLEWRAPNGKLQEMSCRKALLKLHHKGEIKLPEIKEKYSFQNKRKKKLLDIPETPKISSSIVELGTVSIIPVSSRHSKASDIWNVLMEKYHYLGKGPLLGTQIRYLVKSESYGWIGALSFSGSSWSLRDRDKSIGWSESARRKNLQKVVSNSRFLILPQVRVKNLASYVLSRSIEQLSRDWLDRYGYKPVLIETYVDPERYSGTSYRASNWIYVGKTSGRSRKEKVTNHPKDIYIYPLRRDYKTVLCDVSEVPLGSKERSDNYDDWVEEEFGSVEFYDDRLRSRLLTMARDFYAKPGALVPQACNGSEAKTKGAYRFVDNKNVDVKKLLKPHIESTIERMKMHQVVLAVQDTTMLNYTKHTTTEGLGPIGVEKDSSVGLILHDTVAFSSKGTPLGVLDVQFWARDESETGKRKYRHELPIEQKESYKWLKSYRKVSELQSLCPTTTLVSIGDREADIYELFYEATHNHSGAYILVRAERSRNRIVEQTHLWEKMKEESVAGYQKIHIPGKGSRKERTAKLEIRFARVELEAPKRKRELEAIGIWAVYAHEVEYSSSIKNPLEWMLLTTLEVKSYEDAIEKLEWYTCRWGIEVYHRTLKSGCRIEDRRLNNADRLESCLAIDMVVAWRIYYLTKQSRETPDVPCDMLLEEEWKVLYSSVKTNDKLPNKPPSLRDAVRMIAKLGGFLGRRSDGEPGTTTLWRGLQRLDDIMFGYRIHTGIIRAGP